MEVTEPTDNAFFFAGDYEGRPGVDFRSTVWPLVQRQEIEANWEAKRQPGYQRAENRYVQGPHGFTQ